MKFGWLPPTWHFWFTQCGWGKPKKFRQRGSVAVIPFQQAFLCQWHCCTFSVFHLCISCVILKTETHCIQSIVLHFHIVFAKSMSQQKWHQQIQSHTKVNWMHTWLFAKQHCLRFWWFLSFSKLGKPNWFCSEQTFFFAQNVAPDMFSHFQRLLHLQWKSANDTRDNFHLDCADQLTILNWNGIGVINPLSITAISQVDKCANTKKSKQNQIVKILISCLSDCITNHDFSSVPLTPFTHCTHECDILAVPTELPAFGGDGLNSS